MSASPLSAPRRTPIKTVLIAGAGATGRDAGAEFLKRMAPLRCPIIMCIRDAELDPLQALVDGERARWASDGAELDAALPWLAPADRHIVVRSGRFALDGDVRSSGAAPSLDRLYRSLRVGYGSRVFAVVIDADRPVTPELRLLSQRGARIVSPLPCGPDAVASHWSTDRTVEHLVAALAAPSEVAVA